MTHSIPPPLAAGSAKAPCFLDDRAYPEELCRKERDLLKERWRAAELETRSVPLVGFGLSGGGIRSATFCLGIFQGLARQPGLLKQIDFLSTVSGGGYFGAFLGRLFGRKEYVKEPADVEEILTGKSHPEILRYLRENGRYLSPNGAGDVLFGGAVLLRNWISIHLVLMIFLLGIFLALQVMRVGLEWIPGFSGWLASWTRGGIWWSPFLLLPLVTFVLAAFPIGWAYWLIPHEEKVLKEADKKSGPALAIRLRKSPIPPWTGLTLAMLLFFWLTFASLGQSIAWLWGIAAITTATTFFWWKFGMRRKMQEEQRLEPMVQNGSMEPIDKTLYSNQETRNRLGLWVTWALVITAGLLGLALIDSLGQTVYVLLKEDKSLPVWFTGIFSSWAVFAGFARRIAVFFSKGGEGGRPPLPLQWIATIAALIVSLLLLVSLDTASHAIAWKLEEPPGRPESLRPGEKEEKTLTVEVRGDSGPVLPVSLVLEAGVAQTPRYASGTPSIERLKGPDPGPALLGLFATVLLSILLGQTWPFLNNSSHQSLYSARLTRAYLGASNPVRVSGAGHSVADVIPGDDADLAGYWPPPEQEGSPIHLINVTINETIDGRSQIQQQDRKGDGMALGPCGLSVNVEHHMVLSFGKPQNTDPVGSEVSVYPKGTGVFRVFDCPFAEENGRRFPVFAGEMLPLGNWVGISGAAFSTGTGARTNLGLSLLAGLGNVRLGRWWDSGVIRPAPKHRKIGLRFEDFLARAFPVQIYLLDEFLARFPGPSRRHWYLSDGGHFENLGGYELIRRRLPMIVIVDAEQDGDYTFGGLSNLVRKARLDFGAEIRFLTEAELDEEVDSSVRRYFGPVEHLQRGSWKDGKLVEADPTGFSHAHAALALVNYNFPKTPPSRLLYIKPTLTGDEPADLLEYHKSNPPFPHEPTSDQFFDEAQWESYRRLGEHIAEKLFGPFEPRSGEPRRWRPRLLGDDILV